MIGEINNIKKVKSMDDKIVIIFRFLLGLPLASCGKVNFKTINGSN